MVGFRLHLACATCLAGTATDKLEAVELASPVTRPRSETVIAAEALDQGSRASHRPPENAALPAEANRRGDWKKTSPRRRHRCRIPNLQNQRDTSSALTRQVEWAVREHVEANGEDDGPEKPTFAEDLE